MLAVLLISAAVTFSVLRAILPHATGYKSEIQSEISGLIDLPVEVDTIDAAIDWFSPRLRLIGVSVYDKNRRFPLFEFEEAFVELDVIASIMHGELIVDDVGLVGADLSIEKLSENEWSVQGVRFSGDGSSELPDSLIYMLQNSDYLLHSSNIYYRDNTGDKLTLNLIDVNIDVRNAYGYHDIRFSMNLPDDYGQYLAIVATLSGDLDEIDGDVYIEARQIKLDQWDRKFSIQDAFHVDADVDAELWIELDAGRIESLISRLSAIDVTVSNNSTSQSWQTGHLSTRLRYQTDDEKTVFNLSDLTFGDLKKSEWPVPVNLIAGKDEDSYYLSADFLRIGDLQAMVRVFLGEDALHSADRLKEYALQGDIYNLAFESSASWSDEMLVKQGIIQVEQKSSEPVEEVSQQAQPDVTEPSSVTDVAALDAQQKASVQQPGEVPAAPADSQSIFIKELQHNIDVQLTLEDLSVKAESAGVQLTGLDASLSLKSGAAEIELHSEDADLDFDELFRETIHTDTITGKVGVSFIDNSWQLRSERLQVSNQHIDTHTRFDIGLPDDGGILLDVQTDFYEAYGKYARHYLPVGVMSPALVDWLDMAVTSGYVPDGQFLLHGDFDDFPFDENEGVFQVMFSPQDVTMRFLEDWPPLTDVSGTVKFENRSLTVSDASGETMRAALNDGLATIVDLTDPYLTVETHAHADNEDAQQYIWGSPLDEVLGAAMNLFQISGSSDLDLRLDVPLGEADQEVTVDGRLVFIDSTLYYPALGYEITGLNSSIGFTKDSITSEASSAKILGEEVRIEATTREGESGREVVFQLDGDIGADYLLQTYDWIPASWITGRSQWSIAVEVPYQPQEYLVHIDAGSDMQGVGLNLSDKVQKQPDTKLPLSVGIDVLDEDGLHVDANFHDPDEIVDGTVKLLSVYAVRDTDKLWRFDIDSDYLAGKGSFTDGLDKSTVVSLDLDKADLYALLHKDSTGESQPIKPNNFPSLDWRIKKLEYDDWMFNDVRLETDWNQHGMIINNLTLTGQAMTFAASGTWLTSWADKQETVLQGKMTSSNIGETLTGLGWQRSVDHASMTADFNARWSAEPYGLSWENMRGKSSFEMEKGEILEVEPGAGGRILGLLNIFKLTNRLVFDFDDVTRKGFGFDSIDGEFDFQEGDGTLKKFDVSAPAADVNMFGSIGLIKRDFGLLMRVKPHTDTLTFAGGALLGGVAVGAGLALIQKVFDLGVIGHNVYSITGSWDDPEIEKIVERTIGTEEDDDF